ncbi:MAG: exodeoxyribonuclease V subunit gamma [Alphaproteobacteria bacterium]|nr:exodeoxyribonuclease V subunit gamma [Alphaproteobacteria bacterium]MCB9696268.1 exodeoxyribonuclease V subunit gamma [Alphaproteobacteria bacterium]
MPLLVHRSNRTERLVAALADHLASPTDDPFAADAVVVHGKGLERYLQHALAQRLGVCANVHFPFPQQLLAQIQRAALGDVATWTRDALVWALLTALDDPAVLGHPALSPLRAWLAVDPQSGDRRRMELVHQLASLFERYASYRPELVATWADPEADPGWEPVLWRAVAQRLDGSDPGSVALRLEQALRDGVALPGVPRRIAFFSVGTLPPLTLRLVDALATHRDVRLFLLSPSRRSDGDHPLLSSLGRLARDFERGVEALSPALLDAWTPPDPSTVLGALQADLLEGRTTRRPLPADPSVRLHACHGPARQVQVLRDELLWLLDTVPDLQPRDIVVMAPDIEVFAPLVQATFSDGAVDWHRRHEHPGGLPRIPFRVADRGWGHGNAVARLLLGLLELVDGRLTTSSVLDLAELPPVQARFGFDAEDLPTVREWVVGSGVRWGADAAHRVQHGLPDDDAYTWRFGLDRLLLGQATAGDDLLLDRVPLTGVEGRDERALLAGVVDLVETVLDGLAHLREPRPPAAWRDALLALVHDLVDVGGAGAWQLRQVEQVLTALAGGGTAGDLDRRALIVWLAERLGTPDPGAGFLSGGVTFCQLVPMRAIPFRVVCLLGMDDGAFPRTGARLGFDRMADDPRPGDRSVRDEDRALFLEAMLSARDRLVVLFTGRDPTDDRPRPPAVPVAELLDVLDATFGTRDGRPARDHLITHHPLQPFAFRAFDGSSPAHDRRMLRAAQARLRESQDRPPFLTKELPASPWPDTLPLSTLRQFWAAPIRTLFRVSLGAWSSDDEVTVEDREPLDLGGGLEQWALRAALLDRSIRGDDLTEGGEAWRWAMRCGTLPMGMPGEVALCSVLAEVAAIHEAARPHLEEPERRVALTLPLARTTLVGHATLHGDRQVEVTASKIRGKARFSAWIGHLLVCACEHPGETHVFGNGGTHVAFGPVPADEAKGLLERLVTLRSWGLRLPLLWFPEASWQLPRGLDAVRRSWGRYQEPDAETRRVIGDRCPLDPDVDLSDVRIPKGCQAWELAEELWAPARRYALEEAR